MKAGVVGIGTMGLPIARNLLAAGHSLAVWNRTSDKCQSLVKAGAVLAATIDELCVYADVVLLVLLDASAVDEVLGRGAPAFRSRVANRTFVLIGTTSPEYSRGLELDILACGGHYVEAPVSGSRIPAEQGTLVGMVAGHASSVERVLALLHSSCNQVFRCGATPNALRIKLAINHYLIGMVTVLAESVKAARANGLDLRLLRDILNSGPMACEVSRIKLTKLVDGEFAPQASIQDVATIANLVEQEALRGQTQNPIIQSCALAFRKARDAGLGELDMVAVLNAMESDAAQGASRTQ